MMTDGKDLMATYVKQLLALDENTRTATLQNLSHYAENKQESSSSGDDAPRPRKVSISNSAPETHEIWPEHPLGMTMGITSKAGQPATPFYIPTTPMPTAAVSAADTPVKVPLPPGISSGVPGASAQLQQAHSFLEAAMKNWEACVEQEASQQVVNAQKVQATRATAAMHATQQASLRNARQAQKAQAPEAEVVNLLEKALSDLTTSLPPEAAAEAQQLLTAAAAADGANPLQRGKNAEMMKWLTQHLEKQQAASMQKLSHMVRTSPGDATAAWTPPGVQPANATQGWGTGFGGNLMQAASLARPGTASRTVQWLEQTPHLSPAAAGPCFLPMARSNWWSEDAVTQGALQQRFARMPGASSQKGATWGKVPGVPEGKKESLETLRMHLRALLNVDSKRVLIARKINRLGFASDSVLQAHYSAYGQVERVLVAHSRVKPATRPGSTQPAGTQHSRLRPSGLGFVVMCNAEAAQRILAHGSEQLVNGSVIKVQQFERRMTESGEPEICDGEDDDHEDQEPSSK